MSDEIVSTTNKKIRKLIRDGIREGLSNREIEETISTNFAYSRSRARTIAQTEATKVINQSTQQAYAKVEEEEEGIQIRKIWISSRDEKVRPSHQQLNDSVEYGQDGIPVNDFFEIGSDRALAPAGFKQPENSINCRCTIAPNVIEVEK
jgi:SPP1 gp7 family putative phage head morphogenesis protein